MLFINSSKIQFESKSQPWKLMAKANVSCLSIVQTCLPPGRDTIRKQIKKAPIAVEHLAVPLVLHRKIFPFLQTAYR